MEFSISLNETQWLVIATFVLVAVTAYYAYQTRKTVSEMKKASVLGVRPFLKTTFKQMGPIALTLSIENVGNGPANDIHLEYWVLEKPDSKKFYSKPLLKKGEYEEFFIPVNKQTVEYDYDYFKQNQTTIIVKGRHKDILGKEHIFEEKIDLTAYVKQMDENKVRYRDKKSE